MEYQELIKRIPEASRFPEKALVICLENQSLCYHSGLKFCFIDKTAAHTLHWKRIDLQSFSTSIYHLVFRKLALVHCEELNINDTMKLTGFEDTQVLFNLPIEKCYLLDIEDPLKKLTECDCNTQPSNTSQVIIKRKVQNLYSIT